MSEELHWKTVSETLAEVLKKLMQLDELTNFRLVGGTSLCLQLGHRESYDIDMFTDMEYGTIDFRKIDKIKLFRERYPNHQVDNVINGLTNFTGADEERDPKCLKGKFWSTIPGMQGGGSQES